MTTDSQLLRLMTWLSPAFPVGAFGYSHGLENAIREIPEVTSCHYISGTGTFELQVVSRDLNTFSDLARRVLINLPNVQDLHTSFSLGEVKANSALPLAHLQAQGATASATSTRS